MFGFWLKRRLLRSGIWILITMLTLALAAGMGVIRYAHGMQLEKLEAVERDFPVWIRISDPMGTRTDWLGIQNFYIYLFILEGYDVRDNVATKDYFTHVCLKLTQEAEATDTQTGESKKIPLLGITQAESDSVLSPDNGAVVFFYEGYSWADFAEDKAICLLPEGFADSYAMDAETGIPLLTVAGAEEKFEVVGIVRGVSDKIYVPWRYVVNAYRNGEESTESLSAMVADNTRLSEMKERMRRSFTYTDPFRDPGPYSLAMTVFDSQYVAAHKSATRSIELLAALHPIFVVFSAGIGLLAGSVLFRTRKREYALLRSVGAKRKYALWLLTSEFLIAAITGGLLCVVLSLIIPALRETALFAPAVLLCFMLGVATAQTLILRESALKSLQTNE